MSNNIQKKINVLFVITGMDMGGSERLVFNVVKKLDRNRFSPYVAWFYGRKKVEEFDKLNIPYYQIEKNKRIDFHAMQSIGKIIKDHNIHIVNAHHFMPMVYSYYGSKMKLSAKLIFTVHSEWEIEEVSFIWKKIGGLILKKADGFMGVSQKVTDTIQKVFNLENSKGCTISNGVDTDLFKNKINKNELRKKLGFPEDRIIFGTVGNLRKVKNHIFLIKAFHKLVLKNPSVKLIIVGKGYTEDIENSEPELRSYIENNRLEEKVILLGYRSDVQDLLNVMDVYCMTSFKEGLPISMIEAMAVGLPLLGTDVEGIRDVIIPNKNGMLVPANDEEELMKAMSTLANNDLLRKKYGQESISTVEDNYSLKRCIKKYEETFISLLNGNL